tara:strand:- start:123530 stop:123832 length:303 start_codon:yes stop_codon:yes gene_type:complete
MGNIKELLFDIYDFIVPRFVTEYMVMYDSGFKFNDQKVLEPFCDARTFLRLEPEEREGITPIGIMKYKQFNFFGYGLWPKVKSPELISWNQFLGNKNGYL